MLFFSYFWLYFVCIGLPCSKNGCRLNIHLEKCFFSLIHLKRKRFCMSVLSPMNLFHIIVAWSIFWYCNAKEKASQQHLVFPGGHPSKYWLDPTLLNFADRTRSGVFNVVWSLAWRKVLELVLALTPILQPFPIFFGGSFPCTHLCCIHVPITWQPQHVWYNLLYINVHSFVSLLYLGYNIWLLCHFLGC